jgi:hypothetical protein
MGSGGMGTRPVILPPDLLENNEEKDLFSNLKADTNKSQKIRDRRRLKNSAAKLRRISICNSSKKNKHPSGLDISTSIDELASQFDMSTVLSPAVSSKLSRCFSFGNLSNSGNLSHNRRASFENLEARMDLVCNGNESDKRVSMASTFMDDTDSEEQTQKSNENRTQPDYENEYYPYDTHDSHKQADNSYLSESNFRGIIFGGSYQHCFEDYSPVVAAPSGADKRVIGVSFSSKSNQVLFLKLYMPKDEKSKIINLGDNWKWIATSPDGYLVSKASIDGSKKLCYYLPRHPIEWAIDTESDGFIGDQDKENMDLNCYSTSREMEGFNLPMSHSPDDLHYLDDRNDMDLEEDYDFGVDDSKPQPQYHHDHRVVINQFNPPQYSPSSHIQDQRIGSQNEEENEEELVSTLLKSSNADMACCQNIITFILEYLLGDNISEKFGKKKNSRGTRTACVESNYMDSSSYRLVSKCWALGSYRLLARHLANAENCQSLNWSEWSSFVKRNPWGKFLQQGACKNVFCVQNTKGGLEAVSVMDVADLNERGMEAAIAQELEISMLCSSLISLNICPNLVQVSSVFQSEFPAPDSIWRNEIKRPPLLGGAGLVNMSQVERSRNLNELPKKTELIKGCYQYIRMEFCSGGDLEDVVRRAGQINISEVRSMMFQMFFAFYACREKLSMRHFDVKLLNFFVSTGTCLLSKNENNDDDYIDNNDDNDINEKNVNIVNMNVGFGEHVFTLPLQASALCVVKLADFGTSTVGLGGLGDSITHQQFTTLENTPPEFLISGSGARQAYSADTFPLGISIILYGYVYM